MVSPQALNRAVLNADNFLAIRDRFHVDAGQELDFFIRLKTVSMLHVDALFMASECAYRSTGAILEIGPYIGGSTIALARGAKRRPASSTVKIISVEPGGSYPDQPHLPTNDILLDWKRNLSEFGYREDVCLVEGYSNHPEVVKSVRSALGDKRVGLLFVDGNGELERDINLYLDVLDDNCVLVLDDYRYDDGLKGAELTKFIDRMVSLGLFEELGFVPWNTWFGRLTERYKAYVVDRQRD